MERRQRSRARAVRARVGGGRTRRCGRCKLIPLKVLHRPFVLLSSFARVERAKVSALPSLWILLTRIETVLSRFQFSNHNGTPCQLDQQLNSPKRTTIIAAQMMENLSARGVS